MQTNVFLWEGSEIGSLAPWSAPKNAICLRCSRGRQGSMLSLSGVGPATARAAVPPTYPEQADDPLLPKLRAHPLRSIIFLCSATPQCRIAQPDSPLLLLHWGGFRGGGFPITGNGWSPEHHGAQETWLSLKPTGTERFSNGFFVCGAFAQCLGTVSGALPPPSPLSGAWVFAQDYKRISVLTDGDGASDTAITQNKK